MLFIKQEKWLITFFVGRPKFDLTLDGRFQSNIEVVIIGA
jgi:hypothetical protein